MLGEKLIKVVGLQIFDDGSEDKMELITLGNYYQKKQAYYIVYKESEISGMQGVTTSIQINPDKVILNRMGPVELKQQFEHGVLHRSAYITSYGTIIMGVLAKEIDVHLTSLGGNITLKYDLFVEEELLSHNELRINIKEENPHESLREN